jgi:dsDNA-binding SOS-regulon protein
LEQQILTSKKQADAADKQLEYFEKAIKHIEKGKENFDFESYEDLLKNKK